MNPPYLFLIQRKGLSIDNMFDANDLVDDELLRIPLCLWIYIVQIKFQNLIFYILVILILDTVIYDSQADMQKVVMNFIMLEFVILFNINDQTDMLLLQQLINSLEWFGHLFTPDKLKVFNHIN